MELIANTTNSAMAALQNDIRSATVTAIYQFYLLWFMVTNRIWLTQEKKRNLVHASSSCLAKSNLFELITIELFGKEVKCSYSKDTISVKN